MIQIGRQGFASCKSGCWLWRISPYGDFFVKFFGKIHFLVTMSDIKKIMQETLKELIQKMEKIQEEMRAKYDEMAKKYGYEFEKKKIKFSQKFRIENKKEKISAWKYVASKNFRFLISMPFIYGMIIPAIILDICITIYQQTAFRLYRIPLVKRNDYIIFERKYLDYLNWIEKINCLYCSYVNGLFAYSVEIAARTERFWCPIKAASKPRFTHSWYKEFADYGNAAEWKEKSSSHENGFIDSFGDPVCIPGKNLSE